LFLSFRPFDGAQDSLQPGIQAVFDPELKTNLDGLSNPLPSGEVNVRHAGRERWMCLNGKSGEASLAVWGEFTGTGFTRQISLA